MKSTRKTEKRQIVFAQERKEKSERINEMIEGVRLRGKENKQCLLRHHREEGKKIEVENH